MISQHIVIKADISLSYAMFDQPTYALHYSITSAPVVTTLVNCSMVSIPELSFYGVPSMVFWASRTSLLSGMLPSWSRTLQTLSHSPASDGFLRNGHHPLALRVFLFLAHSLIYSHCYKRLVAASNRNLTSTIIVCHT